MKLDLFKTLWGHDGDIDSAIALTLAADFQGIEAPLPADPESASHFLAALTTAATINTAASAVRDVNGSCPSQVPNSTATIGFT